MEIKIREESFILSPIRKCGWEAWFLITSSVCLKKQTHIYGAFAERANVAGMYQVTWGWARHVRNSNTGIWTVLWIQFLFGSQNRSSLATDFNARRERWVQFPMSPLQAIWHTLCSRGCLKNTESRRPGRMTCRSSTVLLAKNDQHVDGLSD